MASRKKRLTKLEAKLGPASPTTAFPKVVVMQPGETQEEAILRVCGPGGLPPVPPGGPPHVIVVPVKAPPRNDHD